MYKNLLVPIDLAHDSSTRKSLCVAVELAQSFDACLHLITVVPAASMAMVNQYFNKEAVSKIIEATHEGLAEYKAKNVPDDVAVKLIVTTGNVYESIIMAAKKIDADLIIMSAHRPELKDYLLWPNAARVVRHSDRSVLVVRQ